MRVLVLGLAVALGGCWGIVESDDRPEVDGGAGATTEALTDCPELRDEASCSARGPGWVGEVPACLEFGGYLATGCHWLDGECLRGPWFWSRNKCEAE